MWTSTVLVMPFGCLLTACHSDAGSTYADYATGDPGAAGDAAQGDAWTSLAREPMDAGGPGTADAQALATDGMSSNDDDAAMGTMHDGAMSGRDDCAQGHAADPRDEHMPHQPDEWLANNGDIDLVVPKAVLDWMGERVWEKSHDAWHNIRRCETGWYADGSPFADSPGRFICVHTELIPVHQECTDAEDGYEFLVMHRHMIQSLRQAFPKHPGLFEGFPHFPYQASDVPPQWQGRFDTGWSDEILAVADVLEHVESNLDRFPSEGDLGKYIQCGNGTNGIGSIHGALHFKWVVADSPHSLGNQEVNIDNHMFWKLHGWIDQVWERYRVAKALPADEPKLQQALAEQCHEMHRLGKLFEPGSGAPSDASSPDSTPSTDAALPAEHGYFAEQVRPILDKNCSGCHRGGSPPAGLSLGGNISSADIVAGLVNIPSMHGGQFKRVVPGKPEESWFYLKTAGLAATAGCAGATCNPQVMPPAGKVTLTPDDLGILYDWIANGAVAPTP